jgi:hypothetical protein
MFLLDQRSMTTQAHPSAEANPMITPSCIQVLAPLNCLLHDGRDISDFENINDAYFNLLEFQEAR